MIKKHIYFYCTEIYSDILSNTAAPDMNIHRHFTPLPVGQFLPVCKQAVSFNNFAATCVL